MLGLSSYLPHAASLFLLLIPAARSTHSGRRPSLFGDDSGHARDLLYPPAEQGHSDAQTLVAVRKMTATEDEMFFQHFWQFDFHAPKRPKDPPFSAIRVPDLPANASIPLLLQPPLALHRIADLSPSNGHWARALLQPHLWDRAFQCPTGTNACTAIDRPDSCCPSGNTCQLVRNKGQGDVACCATGQTCVGDVQDCAGGYEICPGAAGGGCCVPGYACVGTVGCVHSSTTTVIVTPQVTASPPPSSSSPSSSPRTTTANITPIIPTSQTTITTSTTSTTSSSSSPPPTPTTTTTSSNAFIPPARPTSTAVVTTSYLSDAAAICPTGFYQCSAYYHGGCCRVGRDCGLTDCPTSGSTTVAANNGNGVTIVAPTPAGPLLDTGNCASGWQSCARDVGGGCCPGDFECGVESCTKGAGAKVTGGGEGGVSVGKSEGEGVASGGFRIRRWGGGGMVVVVVVGIRGFFLS